MESKYILPIIAVLAAIAIVISGISLGLVLTKNDSSVLNETKYTVYVGTDCEELENAEEMMIDIIMLSEKHFGNGYTAFVATGGTSEDKGIVVNKYSVVLIYGMVTDEKALQNFIEILKVEYPTSVILQEKTNAHYDLYIPASDVVYG